MLYCYQSVTVANPSNSMRHYIPELRIGSFVMILIVPAIADEPNNA